MTAPPILGPMTSRILLAAVAAICLFGSCESVDFYEKEAFTDPTMELAEDRCEIHWYQKVFYSQEGSAGGIGTVAGGGCGCY